MGIFSRFSSRRRPHRPDRLRRWVMPAGADEPETDELKRAAAADVAALETDDTHIRRDRPGGPEDDL
jgi:hypothetical protein